MVSATCAFHAASQLRVYANSASLTIVIACILLLLLQPQARDALYDIMWSDAALTSILNATRKELLLDSRHPTTLGHALFG
jgi:hypothetical protein